MGDVLFPKIIFSNLELQKIGWSTSEDIIKSAIFRLIKEEITRKIRSSHLSYDAYRSLLNELSKNDIHITIPDETEPDFKLLPTEFSNADEEDEEHEKVRIAFQWKLRKFLEYQATHTMQPLPILQPSSGDASGTTYYAETGTIIGVYGTLITYAFEPNNVEIIDISSVYPYNLVEKLFKPKSLDSIFCPPNFYEQTSALLDTLPDEEAADLKLHFKYYIQPEQLLKILGLPITPTFLWAAQRREKIKVTALCKLRRKLRQNHLQEYVHPTDDLNHRSLSETSQKFPVTYIIKKTELESILEKYGLNSAQELRKDYCSKNFKKYILQHNPQHGNIDTNEFDPVYHLFGHLLEVKLFHKAYFCASSWSVLPPELLQASLCTKAFPELIDRSIKAAYIYNMGDIIFLLIEREPASLSESEVLLYCIPYDRPKTDPFEYHMRKLLEFDLSESSDPCCFSPDTEIENAKVNKIGLCSDILEALLFLVREQELTDYVQTITNQIVFCNCCKTIVSSPFEKSIYTAYTTILQDCDLSKSIEDLNLSEGLFNRLRHAEIKNLAQIVAFSYDRLRAINYIGKEEILELSQVVSQQGIEWYDKKTAKKMIELASCHE